ncbi:hypothetical protein ACFQAS_07095 [Halopenitus salinus]|uniref:Uncharacterized protein n=1 Tax=Halopenitus salinus TaxID=1198295 RepID=A0ABD5V2U1_9EURY
MSANQTSHTAETITEPSDEYAATPEVDPPTDSKSVYTPTDSEDDGDKDEIHINGEAYNDLTKPDPHCATFFSPSDVRGEKWVSDFLNLNRERYFRMLSAINRGEKNGPTWEHSQLHTYRLRKDLVEIIGQRLNLTERQIERSIARATNIDGEKFGQRLELAVFCTCAYVVHRDESGYTKERHFHPNSPETDELFEEVAEEFNLSENRIENVCRMFDQTFGELPPVQFDSRKPNWKANEHPDRRIVESPSVDEKHGQRWRGGI